jgi:hypothetical protein
MHIWIDDARRYIRKLRPRFIRKVMDFFDALIVKAEAPFRAARSTPPSGGFFVAAGSQFASIGQGKGVIL